MVTCFKRPAVEEGNRFNKWTVLERIGRTAKAVEFHCRCDCGTQRSVTSNTLLAGSYSCGCEKNPKYQTKSVIHRMTGSGCEDLSGLRFGRLEVLHRYCPGGTTGATSGSTNTYWVCKCDCGTIRQFRSTRLKNGTTVSCGCFGRENRTLPNGGSIVNKIWKSYVNNAAAKSIVFELNRKDFETLIFSKCFYCGREPYSEKRCRKTTGVKANGIDRRDSDFGYLKENCVACCSECNYMKNKMNVEKFLDVVRMIANNHSLVKGGDAVCLR